MKFRSCRHENCSRFITLKFLAQSGGRRSRPQYPRATPVVVRRAMLRVLLLAHGLALTTGFRVNAPADLAGEYEDTPADFAPANYEVTALGVLAASCPCEWATDSSPIHKGWLWDRILIVDDEVCANSCTAPVAACAAQLANASGLLVTDRYNPSKQLEGPRDPRLKGDFAANDPSINATCQVAIPTAYVNSSVISLLAAAKLVTDAPRLPPLIWSASQIRCSAPSPAPPCRSTVAWSVGRRAMRTSHMHTRGVVHGTHMVLTARRAPSRRTPRSCALSTSRGCGPSAPTTTSSRLPR